MAGRKGGVGEGGRDNSVYANATDYVTGTGDSGRKSGSAM